MNFFFFCWVNSLFKSPETCCFPNVARPRPRAPDTLHTRLPFHLTIFVPHWQRIHSQLIRSLSFITRFVFSHFHGVLCLPPVYLLLWGSQPSQASGASKWLLLFDRLWCARNRGWNRIIMGKMVLVVICTGKCWPCCCFMYLFIPHTGKFVFNCVSCALAKRTLAQPHRIPFKPGDFFFASSWSPRNVSIALRTRGGEEGQISETTLKRSRISQLIFECCCCYFFFLGRVVSVTKPWVVRRGKKRNTKRVAEDEKSVWSWVEFKLLGLNHLPHTRSL